MSWGTFYCDDVLVCDFDGQLVRGELLYVHADFKGFLDVDLGLGGHEGGHEVVHVLGHVALEEFRALLEAVVGFVEVGHCDLDQKTKK